MTISPNPRSTFSAICVSNGVVRVRTRATVGPRNFVDYRRASAYSQSAPVTSFVRWIAAILPERRRLAGRFERSGPVFGARLPAIFSRIRRDIRPGLLNSVGAFKALRSLSSNAFVQFCQEPTSRVFHRLTLAPVLSPVPVLHTSNRHQKDTRDHGKSYAQHG